MVTKSSSSRLRITGLLASAVAATALLAACGGDSAEPAASASASAAVAVVEGREVLLEAQELTTLDQPISYPKKTPAQVTSYVTTLEPGQETTVEIENIHVQLRKHTSVARAIREGNRLTAVPRLLSMLCVLCRQQRTSGRRGRQG